MGEWIPTLNDWFLSTSGRAVLVSIVANAACALVGVMLVVRRQSLMGDAISHAVLPGLAVAFLWTESLGTWPMLLGALGAGLATTFLTEMLRQRGGVSADAALGVVYTSLFALGVLLVKRFLTGVHFDVACVYEGSLLHAALDTVFWSVGGASIEVPRALLSAGLVLLVVVVTNVLLWKELRLCAFDPALATTMGFSAPMMHYLVMGLVALTAAVAFEAVGAILVVAMMIAPAATAQLWFDRLRAVTLLSVLLAVLYGVLGYLVAEQLDVSPSGLMATIAGLGYGVSAVGSPRHGAFARMLASMRLAAQVRRDDLLAYLFRAEERSGAGCALAEDELLRAIGGGFWARHALKQLEAMQHLETTSSGSKLTSSGRAAGAKLVRSHRLWEKFLVERVGLPEDHVHEPADRVEHFLDQQLEAEIEAEVEDAKRDPHGREIPGG